MRYVPHEYQQFATDFIVTHPTAAIFLDMGMGKSSITLTAIERLMYQEFEVRKVLIIAPLRVAKNTWPAEIQKWDHLKGLTWSVIIGTQQERMAALRREADIYLINRENTQWLIEKSGMPFDYDMVVIDELSSFKSWQSKRFRSLMKVRPFVRRIVGLTGTPSSNGLMDLFAEFRVLDMGQRLGRFIGQYRNAFFKPDRMNGPIVYSYKPLPGAEEEIYRRIGDITISMKACGHLKMPELISTTYEVEMSPDEQEQYDAMKQELVLSLPDGEVTAANAAVLTGKLLQMSNGAIYTDEGNTIQIHDRKLDALEDIIEGMNGRPLLLAYWFKHDLQRITERLTQIGVPFEVERWTDPGWTGAPGIHRAWTEPAGRRQHHLLVFADMVSGTVPADERPPVPAGAEGQHRCGHAHRDQRHGRFQSAESAGRKGSDSGGADRCGESRGEAMTGYQALANGIIEQAVKDYRAALKTLRRHPDSKAAMATAMEVERFFHSSWFAVLTDIDPDYLIERLRKEAVK